MKRLSVLLLCAMLLVTLTGCQKSEPASSTGYQAIPGLDTKQKAAIVIAIPYETNKALNTVANGFMDKYPNVSVELRYIEDYDTNALQLFKAGEVDIILRKDTFYEEYAAKNADGEMKPDGTTTEDFFYNFAADTEIDFSDTTPDITDNYRHTREDADGKIVTYQYSYPIGGETRGVFVNTTLLEQYGLQVPTNYDELIACCEKLKAAGLVPIQGGGDTAAYSLGLAPAANPVVHDEAALKEMAEAKPGVSARFEGTMRKLYNLAVNRYFDYKAVEESGYFLSTTEYGQAESFLGLRTDKTTFEVSKPENGIGMVAFLPYISSMHAVIDTLIDEYKLDTKVKFICSPLNDAGSNSPAYVTPYYGLCINKNSASLIWAREFTNYLFQAENNKVYAEEASILPNTTDAMQVAAARYGLDVDKDITLCGQIRFSDSYNGYSPVSIICKDIMKSSAPKYMVALTRDDAGQILYETDEDGREYLLMGNGETKVYREYIAEEDSARPGYAFCTFDYYMDKLESNFAKYRME